jgi:ADP-ribosylglycohydrolase
VRKISLDDYKDRVYGAWLGGIVGTMLGWTFEGHPRNVDAHLDHYINTYTYAPVDDDYYYEMVALYGFERHGIAMTIEQLGEMWVEYQAGTWGSSEQARLLLEKGIKAPHSGEPRYNRWFHTVGAQFSSDMYGMITAGMINLAGATARQYSHVNGYAEGSDGAVFVAGCISEAFFETDPEKVVREAAALISPKSNYRKALDQVLEGFDRKEDWRQLASEIEDRWRPDYPQMNNSVANGALVALGVLYGEGDYLKSVNIVTATDDFTDADCNGDNVGSIVGAMLGVKGIPAPLVATINDRIYGESMGKVVYKKVVDARISDLAARIAAVGVKLLVANGAVEKEGSLLIPHEPAHGQPLEWFDVNDYGQLWNSEWNLSHAGRGGAGATYLQWEDNTLVTFPRDTRPCRLERQARLPGGHPELALVVGCAFDRPWRLQALVNNETLLTEHISTEAEGTEPQYREFHLDLSKFSGQTVTLRLYHWLEGGKPPGSAYWRKAEIREV